MQDISIYKFQDPFFSKQLPICIYGPPGCGKMYAVKNELEKEHIFYVEINGSEYREIQNSERCVAKWLKSNYPVILDDFPLSENLHDIIFSNPSKVIYVGTYEKYEDIPAYIKNNFEIIHHTEIKYLSIN